MQKETPTLSDLRREIDQIDDHLHDLLIRRTQISQNIAKLKNAGQAGAKTPPASAARPAREAAILRRLLTRHSGGLQPRVIVSIWREIMAASLKVQSDFQVHVFTGDDQGFFSELARDHFGTLTSIKSHSRASGVLQACTDDAIAIGLLPIPEAENSGRPWWAQLAPAGETGPRVIAKLPILSDNPEMPSAYAIGSVEQEPSGDDTTLLLLEAADGHSRTKILSLLTEAGFDARLVAAGRHRNSDDVDQFLFEVSGFAGGDDPRLKTLADKAGGALLRAVSVGGFANPIMLAAGEKK